MLRNCLVIAGLSEGLRSAAGRSASLAGCQSGGGLGLRGRSFCPSEPAGRKLGGCVARHTALRCRERSRRRSAMSERAGVLALRPLRPSARSSAAQAQADARRTN